MALFRVGLSSRKAAAEERWEAGRGERNSYARNPEKWRASSEPWNKRPSGDAIVRGLRRARLPVNRAARSTKTRWKKEEEPSVGLSSRLTSAQYSEACRVFRWAGACVKLQKKGCCQPLCKRIRLSFGRLIVICVFAGFSACVRTAPQLHSGSHQKPNTSGG
ncbi:hypothetical protein AAFF_G00073120 [Aldrovandia affinis]|uniref:Uncharacterized protein n=1 Tax=Aldrovandia affinis TaxID=143900 RepID=A0AAD7WDE7_9TELE|nr:hypothetical protein AAFF_G00073120 [Aldrovandia affinis]